MREHPRDLRDVIEIVDHPRGEQLPERDGAERRMPAAAIEIGGGEAKRLDPGYVLSTQSRELVEQARQASSPRRLELCKADELVERRGFAGIEDPECSRQPIGPLAVDQVTDDVEGAPGVARL